MKRKMYLAIAVILAIGMFAMTSCSGSFGVSDNNETSMTIVAEKAAKDLFFVSGTLEVDEGDQIVITPSLEKGSVDIELIAVPEEQSIDELPDTNGPADFETVVSGTDVVTAGVGKGSYMVRATVKERASGTIDLEVVFDSPEKWSVAESAEEAGEKAGVSPFAVDPSGTSLGEASPGEFRYMEGVAEAHYGVAAVELFVRKGLASIDEGDISFDNNDYMNEWTVDIDGTEVTCYGNREGEATKSIWTNGDYSYAILAYGAGGDDDYGLSEDDLKVVIGKIQ